VDSLILSLDDPGVSRRALRADAGREKCSGLTAARRSRMEHFMIIIGIVLLIIGFLTKIAVVWTLGIIALVVGLILMLLGAVGHAVGPRRHYW
jgi:uncharacterized membrane protein HdeD (DUF308 family)